MQSKDTVTAELDRVLKPLGFLRKNAIWNRNDASVVEALDIQFSRNGDAVTVNAGVLDTGVHALFWSSALPKFIEQPMCTVGARIGELIDGKDKWWQLSASGNAGEIADNVTLHVLPFLESMHTREAMASWRRRTIRCQLLTWLF